MELIVVKFISKLAMSELFLEIESRYINLIEIVLLFICLSDVILLIFIKAMKFKF